MATALEKFDKIDNVHDDGASTKLSDQTTTTKASESTLENGEQLRNCVGMRHRKKTCPKLHEYANTNESDIENQPRRVIIATTIGAD